MSFYRTTRKEKFSGFCREAVINSVMSMFFLARGLWVLCKSHNVRSQLG